MAGFVQLIEWRTSRVEDVRALSEEYKAGRAERGGGGGPSRVLVLADRDRPGTFYTIAQFESVEVAEANNDNPETQAFAARLTELCDGPPTFRNTDVLEDEVLS